MKRSELARLLQDEALRRGIPIEFGRRLVEVGIAVDGRALARFDDGTEATGDVLIGADGVHSIVRRRSTPARPTPATSV